MPALLSRLPSMGGESGRTGPVGGINEDPSTSAVFPPIRLPLRLCSPTSGFGEPLSRGGPGGIVCTWARGELGAHIPAPDGVPGLEPPYAAPVTVPISGDNGRRVGWSILNRSSGMGEGTGLGKGGLLVLFPLVLPPNPGEVVRIGGS